MMVDTIVTEREKYEDAMVLDYLEEQMEESENEETYQKETQDTFQS